MNYLKIPISKNQFTLIDKKDYDKIKSISGIYLGAKYSRTTNSYYVICSLPLHILLMGKKEGRVIDHKNHNTLDNRKSNLRFCTHVQNNGNRRKIKIGTSKFKGVSWCARAKMWIARIHYKSRGYHLGYFSDEVEAAKAYDQAALNIFGEFAFINFHNIKYKKTKFDFKRIKGKRRNSTSKYRGVHWSNSKNKWIATIVKYGKLTWIGGFNSEVEAAKAYDNYAKQLFGETFNFKK